MKFRIRMVVETEFVVNPDHYPAGATPDEMLRIDIANCQDEPEALFAGGHEGETVTITGEVIA